MKKLKLFLLASILQGGLAAMAAGPGATVPWATYEAESLPTTGYVLGPDYYPYYLGVECSGRSGVDLYDTNQYVELTASQAADALVIRYNVPDTADGVGADYTLSLYTNGVFAQSVPMTSRYTWLYGNYPFSNNPGAGAGRNLYDEVRVKLSVEPGEVVRLQKNASDMAAYYCIDLIDLETVPAPLSQPVNSLSILSYGADPTGATDSTTALRTSILAGIAQSRSVWAPPGTYKITGSINLPSNIRIQGAGMWHTLFIGDAAVYTNSSRRVTFNGNGSNIRLADFAILGKLTYRNDTEPNDGLGGAYGTGSALSRIWVEHTKTGAWLVNSLGLVVDGCRFRNTIADGINLAVGMRSTLVTNCTARGNGDDCFAIWPANYMSQNYVPGLNVFDHCTAQMPFLANCGAIYGGFSNTIQDCFFQDACYNSGVLISTTFPVGTNIFSGVTTVRRTEINRCGGQDFGGNLSGSLLLYLNNSRLTGINLDHLKISNNLCDGLDIIAPGSNPVSGVGTLSNAIISKVTIPDYGLAFYGSDALWADSSALGSMIVSNSAIVDFRNLSARFSFLFTNTVSEITSIAMNEGGQPTLKYTATPGAISRLESSTNPVANTWVTVPGSAVSATQPVVTFIDTNSSQSPAKFYRSVLP